ncbi:hypothetical protein [Streptomyces sp. NPDC047886]|uniref:hypothetical protein n=1 Tax=Streptomyces sp. NPDC047886 TaxID=3365490 RepID=UPI0037159B36
MAAPVDPLRYTGSLDPDFRPSHVVPRDGLAAWDTPDPSRPTTPLDPFLPVQLVDRLGDWGRVVCSNGWSAWVDGRLLVPVPPDPPAARQPMTRTADPRPLLARAEGALSRYRQAVEELAAGRSDGEDFRRRTRGLRVGLVVDGEALWLYDAGHERWVYCDGTRLLTYASESGPSAAGSAPAGAVPEETEPSPRASAAAPPASPLGHEPTRVVSTEPAPEPTGAPAAEPTRVVERGDERPGPARAGDD